jgi:hypothetical protein
MAGQLLGGERYDPKRVKKKAAVPNKSVGTKSALQLIKERMMAAIVKSKQATADVFSARAKARADVLFRQKLDISGMSSLSLSTPLIARTTSAHPDNIAGRNRPYIQVLSLGNDPGLVDATRLKAKSNLYDTFIISSVSLVDAEKLDVVETFGKPHFFASGSFTKKAVISGVVRSQARNPVIASYNADTGVTRNANLMEANYLNRIPDYVVFRNFYENYLRATLQAASNTFTRVYVDGDYYDGFVQNLSLNITAESEQTIPWSMSMLLLRSWNVADAAAKSAVLSKIMDPLTTERVPLTDREALAELSDMQGTGELKINGGKAGNATLRKYTNGVAEAYTSNLKLELDKAAMCLVKVEFPEELDTSVSIVVETNGDTYPNLAGYQMVKNASVHIRLKVNSIAKVLSWAMAQPGVTKGEKSVKTNITATLSVNNNPQGACTVTFPVEIAGGETLVVTSATYTAGSVGELTGSVDPKDPLKPVVTLRVPKDRIYEFFNREGFAGGALELKFSGKAGKLEVSDANAVKYNYTGANPVLSSASLAPSEESGEGLNPFTEAQEADKSLIGDPEYSGIQFTISSRNAAFVHEEGATVVNPFKSSEAVVYPLNIKLNIPGYEESNILVRIVVELNTPAALKGIITGDPTASVRTVGDSTNLTLNVPIADSAYVDNILPPAVLSKIDEEVVELTLISGGVVFKSQVSLRSGSTVTLTSPNASFRLKLRRLERWDNRDLTPKGSLIYQTVIEYADRTGPLLGTADMSVSVKRLDKAKK